MTNNRNQNSIFGKATKALLFVMLFVFSFAIFLSTDTPILSDNQTAQVAEATAGAATYTISSDNKIVPTYRGIGTAGYYSLDELWNPNYTALWTTHLQTGGYIESNTLQDDANDGAGIKFVSTESNEAYSYSQNDNYVYSQITAPTNVTITNINVSIAKGGLLAQTQGSNWHVYTTRKHKTTTYFYIGSTEVGNVSIEKGGDNGDKEYSSSVLSKSYDCDLTSGSSVTLKVAASFSRDKANSNYNNKITAYAQVKNISIKVLGYYTGFSGSGTQSDPYLLTCREDFDGMALSINSGYYTDKYFKVQPNPNISGQEDGKTINMQNTAFTPIGIENGDWKTFNGTLDGNNCKLTDLKIDTTYGGARHALFGGINGATIKNLTIESGSINGGGQAATGGFVGYAQNGTIQNCVNKAQVRSTTKEVGGIVGSGGEVTIEGCANYGTISGAYEVGGIAGTMQRDIGKIKNCYNEGPVTSSGSYTNDAFYGSAAGCYTGGIVGSSKAPLSYCYNKGAVTSSSNAGFIAGIVSAYSSTVTYCYNIGNVNSSSGLGKGSIAGHGTYEGDLSTCWAFYQVGQHQHNAKLTIAGTGAGFNGNNISEIAENGTKFQRGRLAVIYGFDTTNVLPGGVDNWVSICSTNIESFTLKIIVQDNMRAKAAGINKGGKDNAQEHAYINSDISPAVTSTSSNVQDGEITAYMTFNAGANPSFYGYALALVPLEIQTRNVSKVYGETINVNSWIGSIEGQTATLYYYQNGDDVTSTVNAASYVPYGSYVIGLDLYTGGALTGRFTKDNANPLTLTVSQRPLDFTSNEVTVFQTTAFNGGSFTLTPNTASGNTGILSGHTVTSDTATVVNYSSPNVGNFDVKFSNIKIMSGGTEVSSNYSYTTPQTFTGYFHVIQGDFGRNSAAKWGTQSNPYLIETAEQLQRLSQIVNGVVSPVNSVAGVNSVSSSDVQATGISYAGAYFQVVNTITAPTFATDASGISSWSTNRNSSNGNETIDKLFDGRTDTKYGVSSGADLDIRFQYPSAVRVKGFYFITANDTASYPGRNPSKIQLYGSNDNSNWTLLDNRTNNGWTTANYTRVNFDCNTATGSYRYFRLVTNANGGDMFQLSEFGLISNSFVPIGTSSKPFQGTFDGNNKTISDLLVYGIDNAGLFGYTNGATISNLTVSGNASGANNVGGIVGYAVNTTVSGCTNSATVTGSGNYVGGVVGYAEGNAGTGIRCTLSNLTNNGSVTGSGNYVGGIVGFSQDSIWTGTFTNGNANSTLTVSGAEYVGGLVGLMNGSNVSGLTSVVNNMKINGNNLVGGILGGLSWGEIKNSTNNATITGTNTNYVGGIIGKVYGQGIIGANTNNGTVSGAAYVGGIAGACVDISSDDWDISISNCTNSATISGTGNNVGGIVGYTEGNITKCENTTTVTGANNVGGIVGAIHSQGVAGKTVANCYNSGTVTATAGTVGGIIGDITDAYTIEYCYNGGKVNGGTNANYKIGGIIGYISTNINAIAQYCYNEGQICVNNSPNNSANAYVGEIIGYRANNSAQVYNCYAFFSNITEEQLIAYNHNIGKSSFKDISGGYGNFVIISGCTNATVLPESGAWTDIINNDITSFKYFSTAETIATGNYLSISDFDEETYVAPKSLSAIGGSGSDVTVENLVFNASTAKNICISKKEISLKPITLTYTGSNQIAYLNYYYNNPTSTYERINWWQGNPTDMRVLFAKTSEDDDDINAGTFNAYANIRTPSSATTQYTLGTLATTAYTINKANPQVMYGGTTYGAIMPVYPLEPTCALSTFVNLSYYNDYPTYDGDKKVLFQYPVTYDSNGNFVYDTTSALNIKKFSIAVWNGIVLSNSAFTTYNSTVNSPNSQFTVTYGCAIPSVNDFPSSGIYDNANLYVEISGANFNTCRIYFTLIMTDFDKFDQARATAAGLSGFDAAAPWGSAQNPYVISSWVHMVRLMEIVNGTSNPINSVAGKGIYQNISDFSHITLPSSSSTTFANGNFFLVANSDSISVNSSTTLPGLDLTQYLTVAVWRPIGYDDNLHCFAGSFDGNGKAIKMNWDDENRSHVGLFGYVKSNSSTPTYIRNLVIAGTVKGNEYVGALASEISGNVYIYNIKNYSTITATGYIGGIVGKVSNGANLGAGAATSSYLENYGTINATGNYVGGIAGIILSGSGILESGNNFVIGENAGFLNFEEEITASRTNSDYVGGIFGAMTTVSGGTNFTRFQPKYARSSGNVIGHNYVGGLFGEIQYSDSNGNIIYIINVANENSGDYFNEWSFSGHPNANGGNRMGAINHDGTLVDGVYGYDYVGGVAGKLGNGFHQFGGVYAGARVEGHSYVGGFAGQADNGKFENCFVANPDGYTMNNNDTDFDFGVKASGNYVGGMIGNLAVSASVVNCIVQNFDLNKNNPDNYIGGLVGYTQGAGANITGYAIFTKPGATYTDILPSNNYGSYIVIDKNIALTMTVRELFVYAGLRASVTDNKYNASNTNSNTTADAGYISIGATLPATSEKKYVVFFGTKGTRTVSTINFTASNDNNSTSATKIFIRFENTEGSMIIATEEIKFDWNNVGSSDMTVADNWRKAYQNASVSNTLCNANVGSVTYTTTGASGDETTTYSFTFQTKYSVVNTYYMTSRNINPYQFVKSAGEINIANKADWDKFISRSNQGKAFTTINLIADLDLSSYANAIIVPSFHGNVGEFCQFNGNEHTIKIALNQSTTGTSLFMGAYYVDFNDLTITGSVNGGSGSNVAAFVGSTGGPLNFYNCHNKASVTGTGTSSDNYGGFIGTSNGGSTFHFENCTNTGNIDTLGGGTEKKTVTRSCGIGGLIGNIGGTNDYAYLDGCRNTGNVHGSFNVAGMVGRTNGYVFVQNCGNSGNITAKPKNSQAVTTIRQGPSDNGNYNQVEFSGVAANTNAGGLLGLITQSGRSTVFGSYNTGNVHGYGNKAGGIMGADCEGDSSSYLTQIFNCYNTGDITTGGNSGWRFSTMAFTLGLGPQAGQTGGWTSNGCQCGGILGASIYVDIENCYNIGHVTANGVAGGNTTWDSRVGGICGYSRGNNTTIKYTYNAGIITVASHGVSNDTPFYAGSIIGHIHTGNPTIEYCYSLFNDVEWYNDDGDALRRGDAFQEGGILHNLDNVDHDSYPYNNGTVLASIDEFTARRNSSGTVTANTTGFPVATASNNSFSGAVNYNSSNGLYTLTSKNSWIYIEGCLPQLAIFAVDTRDGIAMTATNAGTQEMPYVIKDGVDLMGLEALTNMGWSTTGKYFETANADNNLEKDVAVSINLPSSTDNSTAARTNWYRFIDANGNYKYGNNYHLFATGSVYPYMTDGKCNIREWRVGYSNYPVQMSNVKMLYLPDVTKNVYEDRDTTIHFTANNGGGNSTDFNFTGDYAYNFWRASQYVNSDGNTIPKNGNYVWDLNDNRYEAGGLIAQNGSMSDNGNNLAAGGNIGDDNFISISKTSANAFKGNFNGALTYDANGKVLTRTTIKNLNLKSHGTSGDVVGGLFAFVTDGIVKNIAVEGNINAKTTGTSGNVYVGIIGSVTGESTIDGVVAGSSDKVLNIVATAGGTSVNTYTGGIIGYLATANGRSVVSNCIVANAGINGFNGGTGGIVGAITGGARASMSIANCAVTGATITSNNGTYIGGIIGRRVTINSNEYGNLAIDDCYVGTLNNTTKISAKSGAKVVIEGQNTIGGIISNADTNNKGSLTITNCKIFGDVYIGRTTNPQNNTTVVAGQQIGTAIGGIAGYSNGESDSPVLMRGALDFYGFVNIAVESDATIKNIGGLIGYMGPYTIISSGAYTVPTVVHAMGKIDGGNLEVYNVGGVAGISNGGALDGAYTLGIEINTPNAVNLGGFIGYNVGNTSIARTGSVTGDSNGHIIGRLNVGGFIGNNGWNDANNDGVVDPGETNNQAIVNIGASSINGALYGTDEDELTIKLYSAVDGKMHVGGFIGINAGIFNGQFVSAENYGAVGTYDVSKGAATQQANGFGGIVGLNASASQLNLTANSSFKNTSTGQVGHSSTNNSLQFYVGGIIGAAMGDLNIDPAATLSNDGAVYGMRYVGGAIGALVSGNMTGEMANGGNVSGATSVGGIIGVVMQDASIGVGNYTNTGSVTSTATSNGSLAGGVFGAMYGTINGSLAGASVYANGMANFENYGTVTAKSFAGGAIGLVDGSINNARFVNSASLTFSGGDSVGGVIGFITTGNFNDFYPKSGDATMYNSTEIGRAITTSVTNTYFGYISSSGVANITAGASSKETSGNDATAGGVGGVIGTISAAEITSSAQWSNNAFFVNGNVTATNADGVGGVVGQIVRIPATGSTLAAPYITINNMLAHESTVEGRNYVGGIVGFNGSSNTNSGTSASIADCYKIRGYVNGNNRGGIVGGYYGQENNNTDSPKTYSSYWVYALPNAQLLNINPKKLGETLTATWHTYTYNNTQLTASNCLVGVNVPENFDSWDAWVEDHNANLQSGQPTLIKNNNGDYGYFDTNANPYSTGVTGDYTGYFFVYANNDNCPVANGIDVTHSYSGNSYEDIDYWKMIAHTADAHDVTESDIVSASDNSGIIATRHVYATAKGSINPDSSNKYYYLSITADVPAGLNTYTIDNAGVSTISDNTTDSDVLFVSVDTTQAQNVVVYYQPIYMGNTIEYDGVLHKAPIKGLTEKTKTTSASGVYFQYSGTTGERTLPDGSKGYFNEGIDAGAYDVDAYVWGVSGDGQIVNLGRVYSRTSSGGGISTYQWSIRAKTLKVDPTWTTGVSNGRSVDYNTRHQGLDMLEIEGVYARDINTENGLLNVTLSDSANNTRTKMTKTLTSGQGIPVVYTFANAIDANTANGNYSSITYQVTCESNNGNYVINDSSNTITYSWTITRHTINCVVNATCDDEVITYDGEEHSINVSFQAGDNVNNTYMDDTISIKTGSGSAIEDTKGCNVGTYSFEPKNVTITNMVEAKRGGQDVSYNYTFTNGSTQDRVSFTINPATVNVTWESGSSYVYNGAAQGPGFTVKMNYGTHTNVAKTPSITDTAFSIPGAKSTETVSFNLTDYKGTNAKTYNANVTYVGATGRNATGNTIKNNYVLVVTQKTYTIQPATVTIDWESGDNYIYNGLAQGPGFANVKMTDGNRTDATVTPSFTNNTAFTLAGAVSSETLKFTLADYKRVNAGNYTATITYSEIIGGTAVKGNYNVIVSTKSYQIHEAEITINWESAGTYTYNAESQGPGIASVLMSYGTQSDVPFTHSVNSDKTAFTIQGANENETLTFPLTNYQRANADTYTASVGTMTASGNNAEGTTSASNYNVTVSTQNYTISPASVVVSWSDESSFVYNGEIQVPDISLAITYGNSQTKTISDPTVVNGQITMDGIVSSETLVFNLSNYDAVNVGSYNTAVSYSGATGQNACGNTQTENYVVSGAAAKSFSITHATIEVAWGETNSFVYNGEVQVPAVTLTITYGDNQTVTITNPTVSEGVFSTVGVVSTETLTFGFTDYNAVNVGTYDAEIASLVVSGENAGGNTIQDNYAFSGSVREYSITPATVALTWGTTTTFVYTGSAQGPRITNVNVTYGTPSSTESRAYTVSGNSLTFKGVKDSETLTFGLAHYTEINAGNYTAEVTGWEITGTNEAGDTQSANYSVSVTSTVNYSIDKSNLTWTYSSESIDKVYDATSNAVGLSTSNVTFTSTNGGAKNPSISSITGNYKSGNDFVTAVGEDYTVVLTLALTSASLNNYSLQSNTANYSGDITRRGIDITLNASTKIYKAYDNTDVMASLTSNTQNSATSVRSNNYRTGRGFTATNFVSNGVEITLKIAEEIAERSELNSSINGIIKNTVEGVSTYSTPTTSSKDNYLKQAIFSLDQTGEGANYFIRSIVTTGGTAVYSSSAQNTVIHILDNNSNGVESSECYIESDFDIAVNQYNVQASYSNTMQSYANEDNTYNKNWKAVQGTLNVPKSMSSAGVIINVVNKWMFADVTKQLWNEGNYYSPDFNYNTSDDDLYDNAKSIKKYTQFSGNGNATYANNSTTYLLGAYLTSTNGYSHLNLKLRNQPSVVIGYFVNREGYEISTLSGLLLATEYYKGNLIPELPEGTTTETVSTTYVPDEFAEYSTGDVPSKYPTYANNTLTQVDTPEGTTWDQYVDLYRAYILARYGQDAADSFVFSTYFVKNSDGEYVESDDERWNYIVETESDISLNKYMDFVQTNNISGVFTAEDLEILEGEFGNDWGVGSTYLNNVLYVNVTGTVVTFVGSIFEGTFSGSYNGNGYTIDHFNIIANVSNAGDYNVGMFAHVQPDSEKGGKGTVSGIHLRNANVQVFDTNDSSVNGTINVGGIVGLNQSSTEISNSSFHGTIIVNTADANAVVNVGGIVGLDLSSVESYNISVDGVDTETSANVFGAISIANIFATATNGKVNAGGIVGGALSSNSYANVVSMSEIYATSTESTVGGIVGRVLGDTTAQTNEGVVTVTYAHGNDDAYATMIKSEGAQQSTYLANGVYTISGTTYTAVNKAIGNNTSDALTGSTYDALYASSNSLYAVGSDSAYVGKYNASDAVIAQKGTYDVLSDFSLLAGASSDGIHESMRLRDIIDVYVLMYEKRTVTLTGTDATTFGATAYAKGTSWVALGANGTSSSRLNVAYRQHTSLFRMFNYMNFSLNANIRMAAEYGTLADITKIDDGENVVVSYVATPAKESFFGNVSGSYTINVRYKNSASAVLMFEKQDTSLENKLVYDDTVTYQTV